MLHVSDIICVYGLPLNVIGLYHFIYRLHGCLLNTRLHNILLPNETLLLYHYNTIHTNIIYLYINLYPIGTKLLKLKIVHR